jgi:hypothetical protein
MISSVYSPDKWLLGTLPRRCILRAASHYGQQSPVRLQETKNPASQLFTLEAIVHMLSLSKMPTWQYFLTKATGSWRKFGSDKNGNPNYGWEVVDFFSWKYKKLTRSWPLDWRGCFGQGLKWDALSFFGLWAWPCRASHYAWPKAPIVIFYWLFSAHFFGLNKVWPLNRMPLNLDGHNVKWPSK